MGPYDIQGVLLVASVLLSVLALVVIAAPWAERSLRREVKRLRGEIEERKERLNGLNHELYRMQAVVEAVKPDYERAQRLRTAIAEMKRVWLGAGSTEAERERVLRDNLWVLTPEYRDIRLSKTVGEKKGLSLSARMVERGEEKVHLLIDMKSPSEVTKVALEEAHAHAFGLIQRGAQDLPGQRIECLVIGPSLADGVSDMRLSWGSEGPGAIWVRPVTYADLIARAEHFANPPVDPLEAQIVSLAKARAARAAA